MKEEGQKLKCEWPKVRLDECTEIVAGATPSTSVEAYWGGDVCWATPKDMSDLEGAYITDTPRKLTRVGLEKCAAAVLPAGSVLFSSRAPIGHVAVNTVPMATNQGFKSFVPKQDRVVAKFLYWWLRTNRPYLESLGNGATFKEVSKTIVSRIEIPLPPLPEQRRIAEVLDRAEALRAKRRAALAELDLLTQSIFVDLFGDPATNPKGWPRKSLGEVAREKPNNGIFRKNPEYIQEGKAGMAVVWVEELFRGDRIETKNSRRVIPVGADVKKYGLKTGDILFCRSSLKLDGIAFNNVYLGENNEALFECHLIRISPNQKIVSPIFLNCLLRLPQMRAIAKSKSKTATMTTIDQQGLCSIQLPVPPITLQQEFARRVAAVETLKAAHRTSLAELDALFASLQHRAFRGEL